VHDAEAGRDGPWRQRLVEGGLDPRVDITGGGLGQVPIERDLPRGGHQNGEAFERSDGRFLHRGRIVAGPQVGEIIRHQALVLGTEKSQAAELREFLESWGGLSFLHTSLLLST
jgi:hypothetical protein